MSLPTVVLVPCWGSGHFMSALEAGKRLLATGGGAFSLTVLLMHPPTQLKASEVEGHVRRESASGLDIRFLQLPAVEHPAGCADPVEFDSLYAQLHAPHVKSAMAGLQKQASVAAAVVDFFLTTLFDAAHELAVPAYVYFPSPASFLALMLRLPELREDMTRAGFVEDAEATVDVPGLPPVPAPCTPACLVRAVRSYDWFEYHGRRFTEARGVIVNTSLELESSVLAAIPAAPPVHAIGPVIWFGHDDEQRPPRHECVRWLDAQPAASVVFVCFGSMGFLDAAQAREVAVGLQWSGHRFLWVLRGPPRAGSRFPTDAAQAQLDELLPEGFMAACAAGNKGMVWPAWAPQKEILSHGAVGGFVTHCGWNSVLESLWFGVPMLPWPLYGEQHLNAFELVASVGAAVTALGTDRKKKKGSLVEAAELERAVRSLMGGGSPEEEGTKAREKAAEMRAACRKAVGEGGSSRAALQRLVREILGSPANPDGRN